MKTIKDALQSAGKYVLTDHAKEKLRIRVGITSEEVGIAWVNEQIAKATGTKKDGRKTHYLTDVFEIVCDGVKVITVKPSDTANEYMPKFNAILTKEVTRLIATHRRELRKAEINVAQLTLNYLRARNPRTKEAIQAKLAEATDYKALIDDEIRAVEIAGRKYGVEV